jgi:hypothetical protein
MVCRIASFDGGHMHRRRRLMVSVRGQAVVVFRMIVLGVKMDVQPRAA